MALSLPATVLILLLIFIVENGQRAGVAYVGAHTSLPPGVALLPAAAAGALIVIIPGLAGSSSSRSPPEGTAAVTPHPASASRILALPRHPKTAPAAECFRCGTAPAPP